MKNFKKYLWFCRKFHNVKLPKLKFKELNAKFRQLYKTKYKAKFESQMKYYQKINKTLVFVIVLLVLSISVYAQVTTTTFNDASSRLALLFPNEFMTGQ